MNTSVRTLTILSMLAGALATVAVPASAQMPYRGMTQGASPGAGCPGYGMGMMGGMGPGMGMGGGMMGPGMGMMDGGMMGPGMGMMGGGMMGPGMGMMGGMGPMAMLDLTDEQTAQIQKIRTEAMKKQRALMRQMWDEQEKLWDLSNAEKRDPAAIGKAWSRQADLKRQALEIHIDTENRMAAVLTKEQQAQMRRGFRRGMMGN
jgi:Spy/CpxP family protein refolding chaperone